MARIAAGLNSPLAGRFCDRTWIRSAHNTWNEVPATLRCVIGAFRRDSGEHGAMLLRRLPIHEASLPLTPMVPESVQTEASVPAALLLMIAFGLGDPAAYLEEKHGALVQNVVPVPGSEEVQGNAGATLLSFHTENAFHQHRPDFVMLLCLRADHEGIAGLRTACVRRAIPLLGAGHRKALTEAEFATARPPSFGANDAPAVIHPVLSGADADPNVCVDFHATSPQTARAEAALDALLSAFERVAQTFRLRAGDLALVDNRITVHGRTPFRPRYDGRDRWLQRTFVLADIRRSRSLRPHDGNVLASCG